MSRTGIGEMLHIGRRQCKQKAMVTITLDMGSCQNYGPFLGTLHNRCRILIGTPKGTIILTTTHICKRIYITHVHINWSELEWQRLPQVD